MLSKNRNQVSNWNEKRQKLDEQPKIITDFMNKELAPEEKHKFN